MAEPQLLFFRTKLDPPQPPVITGSTTNPAGSVDFYVRGASNLQSSSQVTAIVAAWVCRDSNGASMTNSPFLEQEKSPPQPTNGIYFVLGVLEGFLSSGTEYCFTLQLGVSKVPPLPYASIVRLTTAPALPTPVSSLAFYRQSAQQLLLQWPVPRPLNGTLRSYQVYLTAVLPADVDFATGANSGAVAKSNGRSSREVKEQRISAAFNLPADLVGVNNVRLLMDCLEPSSRYLIRVQVQNSVGWSGNSSEFDSAVTGSMVEEQLNAGGNLASLASDDKSASASSGTVSTGGLVGAIIGGMLAGIAVWLVILVILRRRHSQRVAEVPEVEKLEDLMEQLSSRRFPRLSEAMVVESVKLEDLALKRPSLLLRQELHRGEFGVLRFATIQSGSAAAGGPGMGSACRVDSSGATVARLLPANMNLQLCAAVLLEARILASVHHPNILAVAGVCLEERPFVVAMEYAESVSHFFCDVDRSRCLSRFE